MREALWYSGLHYDNFADIASLTADIDAGGRGIVDTDALQVVIFNRCIVAGDGAYAAKRAGFDDVGYGRFAKS